MFQTIKEKVTSEEVKLVAKQIVISLAIGVAVSLTVHAVEAGVHAAANKISEARNPQIEES